jgi:hypothetical protein
MTPRRGHEPRPGRVAAPVRIASGVLAALLLLWTYAILDNIWNYNDSGTVAYILIASVPGVPGLLLAAVAVHGRLPVRR